MALHYVYILESESSQETYYIGLTNDLKARFANHNRDEVSHTSKHAPWCIKNAISFTDREKAAAFETYLKSHSGRAFAKRHF